MSTRELTVKCPQCGQAVAWNTGSRWRPFCSERCKQIDLGEWASESYRVPVSAPSDVDETPPSDER